jgi:hypothetical protein
MRRCVATVVLGMLLSSNAGGTIALADDASFRFTNNTPETIYLNLYSRSRAGWHWPGGSKRWGPERGAKRHRGGGSLPTRRIYLLWRRQQGSLQILGGEPGRKAGLFKLLHPLR